MENQNQVQSQSPIQSPNMGTRKKVWTVAIAVGVLIILIGGWFVWANYLSPDAEGERKLQENLDKYTGYINTYEAAMKADTYGGKTPQETLKMFIDALKKGDIDLASKYFALDTNEKSPDYLTRKKWVDGLVEISKNGEISNIVSVLESLKTKEEDNSGYASFQSLNENGLVDISVGMILNKYSNVWKIESM